MFTPQMVLPTFLGAVVAGLAIWNIRMTGDLDKSDKQRDRLEFEYDTFVGKLETADALIHDLQKQATMKAAEAELQHRALMDVSTQLAKLHFEHQALKSENSALHRDYDLVDSENESLKLDYGFVKAENERFLTDLTKAVKKIPKHDPTTGRFVKKVTA